MPETVLANVPINGLSLLLFAAAALVPGLGLGGNRTGWPRAFRVPLACLAGAAAALVFGRSTLPSGFPVVPAVLGLLATTALLSEGISGRGWGVAGILSGIIYLAIVLNDFSDRLGHDLSWGALVAAAILAGTFGAIAQAVWRILWTIRNPATPQSPTL
jgi:hypothetical protein